jgi:hypothetical protein
MATAIAADLTAWTRLLAFTGEAKVLATCEPGRCATTSFTSPHG